MSVQAMEEEIRNQIEDLPRLASKLRKAQTRIIDPSKIVFAGSGDSYAASIFAEELSNNSALGSDPYELLRTIDRVRGKHLAIISISGKTRTNLELARRSKRLARERIAITADPSSPLARECDKVVLLEYRKAETLTSGTASFTSALLAITYILGKLPRSLNLRGILEPSYQWAREIKLSKRGAAVFVGSGVSHAMALYGAAKIQEVDGMRAEVDYPEQMGHSHIFSIDKEHDTLVCISSDHDKTWELEKILRKNRYKTKSLNSRGPNVVVNCLKTAIHLQQLALLQAKRHKVAECAFKRDKKTLRLSSSLIY